MRKLTWYYDFVSPYAWLGVHQLDSFGDDVEIECKPVLFAAILDHWGQKGPAEFAPKRIWTYRACHWLAYQRGIRLVMPAAHPFNPIAYLRMAIAAGGSRAVVTTIFTRLWTTGADPGDAAVVASLLAELGLTAAVITTDEVKGELRRQTDAAIAAGVFGVPTFRIGEENFWGTDAFDFARAYLEDPAILSRLGLSRGDTVKAGATRAASAR